MKVLIATLAAVLAICSSSFAQSTTCTSPSYLVPDGREIESAFIANTYWFAFHGVEGHSYVLEYGAFHSNNNTIFVSPTIYTPSDTPCTGGSSTLTVTTTTYVDPYIGDGGSSRRRSWIAPAEGNYLISLASSGAEDVAYRIVDTTLFQPTWSTYGGHYTQAGIQNTTSSTLTCVYTLKISSGGSGTVSQTYTLGANETIFPIISPTGSISISANKGGGATLACTGAPGSVVANVWIFNSTAMKVQQVSFLPRNSQR